MSESKAQAAQAPQTIFERTTLGDLATNKVLISVDANTTVEQVLTLLHAHNILCVPVKNNEGGYLGIINIFDLLVVIAYQEAFTQLTKTHQLNEATFTEALSQMTIFESTVGDFVGLSNESAQFWHYPHTAKLSDVLMVLGYGVHRIVVHLKDSDTLLSQTDIVRFLASKQSEFKEIFAKTIEELDFSGLRESKDMVTVSTSTSAFAAFRKLWQRVNVNLQALPILNDSGALVGTLSAADLRGIRKATLKTSLLPVVDFLRSQNGGQMKAPVTVTRNDTLATVVQKVVDNHVHRVWVVKDDGTNTLAGVVALSDIIQKISPSTYVSVEDANAAAIKNQ